MQKALFSLAGFLCSVSLLVAAPKGAVDSAPKFTWSRGITQTIDGALVDVRGIAADAHGNTYVAGTFTGPISFGKTILVQEPSPEGYYSLSSYFAKFNPGGELMWVKKGKAFENYVLGCDVVCDKQGNPCFLAEIGHNADFGDVVLTNTLGSVLMKYDTNGKLLWTSVARSTNPKKMVIDKDDNILLTGWIEFGGADFGNGVILPLVFPDFNFFIAKYDSVGNALWAHTQEDAVAGLSWPAGVAVDNSGDVYVLGGFIQNLVLNNGNTTLSTPSFRDGYAFIAKYAADGSLNWAKQLSLNHSYQGQIGIDVDQNGHVFVAGQYEGPSSLGGFPLSNSSGTYLAGMTADGDLTWVKQLDNVLPRTLYVGNAGKVYLAGGFNQTATFDSYQLTANGDSNGFLAGFDANGNFSFASMIGGVSYEWVSAVTSNTKGDLYVAGSFAYQSRFGSATLQSTAGKNVFFSRMLVK